MMGLWLLGPAKPIGGLLVSAKEVCFWSEAPLLLSFQYILKGPYNAFRAAGAYKICQGGLVQEGRLGGKGTVCCKL